MQFRKTLLLAGIIGFGLAGAHAAHADWQRDNGGYGGYDRHDDGHWRHDRDWNRGYYPPPPVYYAPPAYYPPPPVYYAPPPPPVFYAPPPVYYAPPPPRYYAPAPIITFGFRP
jgi:hypothetical protein